MCPTDVAAVATTRSLYSPFVALVFRGRERERENMTRAQIFFPDPFGCGPKIGEKGAKDRRRRQAGRLKRMLAIHRDRYLMKGFPDEVKAAC